MSDRLIRLILVAAGAIYAALAWGFAGRQGWAAALWPWPDTPLSFTFIGAICGALGTGALWSGLVAGQVRAVAGSLVALVGIYGSAGLYLAGLTLAGQGAYAPHAGVAAGTAIASAALLVQVLRLAAPDPDPRPLSPLVRLSTGVFALALALAGAALVARLPTVFPWPLSPQSSTLFGLIFLGLSLVYAQVCLGGSRAAAIVALSGFLAYDVILLPPFLRHFARVSPDHLTSLTLYTAVLIYSAGLAIWFLSGTLRTGARSN